MKALPAGSFMQTNQLAADLPALRQSLEAISFDVPDGVPDCERFWSKDGVLCRSVRRFERVFVTVYSVAQPPADWGSSRYFPTDVLVLHHSPRWLSAGDTRNWRFWQSGEHRYSVDGENRNRHWRPPVHFRDQIDSTYIHIDVPLSGVSRGDVLELSCHSITFCDVLEDGTIVAEDRPGIFGTDLCPFLVIDSVVVHKNWPSNPSTPIHEHMRLVHQAASAQQPLELEYDKPIALPIAA